MKIAIPLAGGVLTEHFGHCQEFAVVDVDVETRQIIANRRLQPPAHVPGLLPQWLGEQGVDVIIAGGMGGRAVDLFTQNGVKVVLGAPPEPPKILVEEYLEGSLQDGANACDHRSGGDEAGGHACGGHGGADRPTS